MSTDLPFFIVLHNFDNAEPHLTILYHCHFPVSHVVKTDLKNHPFMAPGKNQWKYAAVLFFDLILLKLKNL